MVADALDNLKDRLFACLLAPPLLFHSLFALHEQILRKSHADPAINVPSAVSAKSVDCGTGKVRERYAPTPHNIRMCTVGARKGDKPCELGRAKSLRRAPFGLLLTFLRINWRCNRHKKRQNQKDDRGPRRPPRARLHDVRIGRWTFALRELRDHPRHTTPHFEIIKIILLFSLFIFHITTLTPSVEGLASGWRWGGEVVGGGRQLRGESTLVRPTIRWPAATQWALEALLLVEDGRR